MKKESGHEEEKAPSRRGPAHCRVNSTLTCRETKFIMAVGAGKKKKEKHSTQQSQIQIQRQKGAQIQIQDGGGQIQMRERF